MFLVVFGIALQNFSQQVSCSQPFSYVQTVISTHGSIELLKVICTALKRFQFPPAFVVVRREHPIAVEEDWSLGCRPSKCENPMFSSLVSGVCIQYEQKSLWQLVWQLISGYYFRLKTSSFFICIESFLQLKVSCIVPLSLLKLLFFFRF